MSSGLSGRGEHTPTRQLTTNPFVNVHSMLSNGGFAISGAGYVGLRQLGMEIAHIGFM